MTPPELRAKCVSEYVLLHVGHQPGRDAATIRLTPSGGPRGEILCCNAGGTTGRWLSRDVIRWLDKQEGGK